MRRALALSLLSLALLPSCASSTPSSGDSSPLSSEEKAMKMYVDGTLVPTSFEENEATKELALHLPLRISMSRYGGFEQVGPIGHRLPTADTPTATKPGDIMLYSGDQIVLFFGENSWSYTRLGRMELDQEALRNLLDKPAVTLTLE